MNELNGSLVIIVLNIREGRGFDFLQRPLYIEGNLKGNKIESDLVLPDSNPSIYTELVWETEKKEVRKLRSSHVPLRIECFTVDENDRKQKIGFILLSLRSAQPVSADQILTVEHKWHKLVSVPSEYRVSHPELALTLTIRDRFYQEIQRPLTPYIEQITVDANKSTEDGAKTVIPITYLEEGLIQIGENLDEPERLTLSFAIGTTYNLDLLLPEEKVFNGGGGKYCIALSLLGLSINTKYFYKNFHEPIVLNDRIHFKLQSSKKILKIFLEQYQNIPLNLYCDQEVLAWTEISLKELLQDEFLSKDVYMIEQDCAFHSGELGLVSEGVDGRKPYVITNVVLKKDHLLNNADQTAGDVSTTESAGSVSNSVESTDDTSNAKGDHMHPDEMKAVSAVKSIAPCEDAAVQTTPRESKVLKSSPSILRNVSCKKSQLTSIGDSANYRLFGLTAVFCSITWRKSLDIKGFQFKIQHPRADNLLLIHCDANQISSGEILNLDDISCNMYFISTVENIKTLITLYPPKIALQNLAGENISEEFFLHIKMLSPENWEDFSVDKEEECTYFALLNEVNNSDKLLCDLQINLKIKELGVDLPLENNERSKFDLDPIILDDWFALKTMKDLDSWKEKQEATFLENLKSLEQQKLELLQVEWSKKRAELETKLQEGMDKCKVLSRELSIAVRDLKIKQMAMDERELFGAESSDVIEMRVTQLLEEEMNTTVDKIEKEKIKLLEKLNQATEERNNVMTQLREKQHELEEVKKTTLTKDQTACLLQEIRNLEEKFQQALLEKTFFKEQWRKALKEVHALKCEDQRQIQQDIRRKKEELSQLSLDEDNSAADIRNTYGQYNNSRTFLY